MEKFLNLNIVQQKFRLYKFFMFKKIIFLILITLPLFNCTTLSEMNEKAKGDGVPYIPGI